MRQSNKASLVIAGSHLPVTTASMEKTIESRDIIGQAKGILMERRDMSAEDAFDTLRALSRNNNIPVRERTEQIVTSREIPD